MRSDEILERVLAQNDRLIELLAGNSPVEVIRALNPVVPLAPPQPLEGPWAADPAPETPADPWGDESVPLEVLRGPISSWRSGWVEGPKGEGAPIARQVIVDDHVEQEMPFRVEPGMDIETLAKNALRIAGIDQDLPDAEG